MQTHHMVTHPSKKIEKHEKNLCPSYGNPPLQKKQKKWKKLVPVESPFYYNLIYVAVFVGVDINIFMISCVYIYIDIFK